MSLESEKELLIFECKKWSRRVSVSEYLTLLGRLNDISFKSNKKVRAALITTQGWQSGVVTLNKTTSDKISLFQVNCMGEVKQRVHTAFISASSSGSSTVTGKLTLL